MIFKKALITTGLLLLIASGASAIGGEEGDICCDIGDCVGGLECTQQCKPDDECEIGTDDDGNRVRKAGRVSVCVPPGKTVICPFGYSSIQEIIDAIIKYIFYIAVVLAPLIIIIGAFLFMISGGDPAKTTRAKRMIIWSAIGLAVILLSRVIFGVIKGIIGF